MPKASGKFRKLALLLIVAGLASAGLWYGPKMLTGNAKVTDSVQNYAEIVIGNLESVVTAQGKLEPKEYVDVGAQVSGLVKKLHVDIGDTVKTGAGSKIGFSRKSTDA